MYYVAIMETTNRDCSSCEYGYCWNSNLCQICKKLHCICYIFEVHLIYSDKNF